MYRNAGLIGFPLSHSLSPTLHSYFFHLSGVNGGYCCFETPAASNICQTIEMFKRYKFMGFNVTVPYKLDIISHCHVIDSGATAVGAVNTVKISGDRIYGYNTDIYGFSKLLENAGFTTEGKNVLLLGAGGAAKAVIAYLDSKRPARLTILNRTREHAVQLAIGCSFDVCIEDNFASVNGCDYDLVINSTSLGLKGENFPDLGLKHVGVAIDLQYGVKETPFLHNMVAAEKRIDGLGMLVYQAAKAFEIWTGISINPNLSLLYTKVYATKSLQK